MSFVKNFFSKKKHQLDIYFIDQEEEISHNIKNQINHEKLHTVPLNGDKIKEIRIKIDETTAILRDNLDKAIQRGDNLMLL